MKKNIVIAGALAVAALVGLTAFGGKTLEQQKAEIAQAVQGKLDMLRAQLDEECTARINAEAQARYAKYVDEMNAAEAAAAKKPAAKGNAKTGKGPNIPSPQPAPQPTKPPVPESQGKWQQGGAPTESKDKWQQGSGSQPAQPQESKSKWQKGGGGQ